MIRECLLESKIILRVTIPIAACTLLESCVYFLNTWMLAKLGNNALAASALVTTLFSSLVMVLWGIFSSSSMIYAHYFGANNRKKIAQLLGTTNILAIAFGIVSGLILWNIGWLLHWLGQSDQTIVIATHYAHGLALAEVPSLLSFSLFNFLEGIAKAPSTLWLSLIYVPLNIITNYILVFGKLGIPAMGVAGVGYGTFIAYCLLVVVIAYYFFMTPEIRIYCLQPLTFVVKEARELLNIGAPLGIIWSLSYLFLFLVAAVLGKMNTEALAAYQIVVQWLSIFSVITISLATALKIRMGFAMGQNNKRAILHANNASITINVLYLLLIAPVMILLPRYLIAFDLDLTDPTLQEVAYYATYFFKLCFIYLFFYCLNYLFSNALIGLKDVKFLSIGCFIGLIVIGVPLIFSVGYYYPTQPSYVIKAMILVEALLAISFIKRYYDQINKFLL